MGIRKFYKYIGIAALAAVIMNPAGAFAQRKAVAEQVVAVVGGSMILLSDIEEMSAMLTDDLKSQGLTSDKDPHCEALESMLMQNLLSTQARIDSIPTRDAEVTSMVDRNIDAMIQQYGSAKALEALYSKPLYRIKDDLAVRYTDMMLARDMQMEIKSKVTITPSETEKFFRTLDKDSLPLIPEQYVYAQIVMYPPATQAAKLRTRERLLELRERIIKGEKMESLARAYSVDPGSASKGGEYDYSDIHNFVTPFADALKKLKPGQVSEVVETEFGFHIIQLTDKRGDSYKFRHILLRPQFTAEEEMVSITRLDSIARAIRGDSITFAAAAEKFSDDKFSKYNSGIVTNHEFVAMNNLPTKNTSTKFLKEELGPDYAYLKNLKKGEVSDSFKSQDMKGNVLSKIIMLKEIVPAHRMNIKDDYVKVEEMALSAKQERVFKEWMNKKASGLYIRIDPRFVKCEFDFKGWVK